MDVFPNLFYFLVIGVLVSPCQGQVTVPGSGIPIYDDCVAYHDKVCPPDGSGVSTYFIKSRNPAGYEPISNLCLTQSQYPQCSGVGWTYIGALPDSADPDDGGYESEAWTAKGINQTVFNSLFWSANVTEICLVSGGTFSIQIPVAAPSLRSLFFGKRILDMTSQQWVEALEVTPPPIFTTDCYEIGFNVGNESAVAARLGIVSTYGAGCSADSVGMYAMGIGLRAPGIVGTGHGYYENGNEVFGQVVVLVRSRPVE